MSALSIQPPFPIFTDIDGMPLENGFVWIGSPNLDPKTNPINVYFDPNFTQLATQPIRTRGGFPLNGSTVGRLYVQTNYSIVVANINGGNVYESANVTERYNDAVVPGNAITDNNPSTINAAIANAIATGTRARFPFAATIRVPEDAPTVQAALDAVYPDPTIGFLITIRLSSGYQIANGFTVVNGDYSNIEITSVDPIVNISPSFVGVDGGDVLSPNSIFYAKDARAPKWRILVNLNDTGSGLVYNRSYGFIDGGKGVINSFGYGLYGYNLSDIVAAQAVFTGAGYGNRVTVATRLSAPQCNFSGAKNEFYFGTARVANLDVSRGSFVYVTGTPASPTNLTGGQGDGLAVRRSFVSATNVDCSNNGGDGITASIGAFVAADGSIANNNGANGVISSESFVSFTSGSSAVNNANYNIYAGNGGSISARDVIATGAGVNGVRAAMGSFVSAPNANFRRNGVSDQSTDIVVSEGSMITAIGSLGGSNVTPMSYTNNGIVIKETNFLSIETRGTNTTSFIDYNFKNISSSNAFVRYLRDTNTTGNKGLIVYRGDGTATVDVQIGGGGLNYFNGNLQVVGTLSKGSGSFKIDHPLKPDTHHLVHSFIEGPQADNIYRGKTKLVNGYAIINIDDFFGMTEGTFLSLNRNLQCFASNQQGFSSIKCHIDGSCIVIESSDNSCNDEISWMIVGERKDKHIMNADWTDDNGKVIIEPVKNNQLFSDLE